MFIESRFDEVDNWLGEVMFCEESEIFMFIGVSGDNVVIGVVVVMLKSIIRGLLTF